MRIALSLTGKNLFRRLTICHEVSVLFIRAGKQENSSLNVNWQGFKKSKNKKTTEKLPVALDYLDLKK